MSNALRLAKRAQDVFEKADAEGRNLTAEEAQEVERLLDRAGQGKAIDDRLAELGGPAAGDLTQLSGRAGGGPGDQFVQSKGWQKIADPDRRPQTWSTGPVELQMQTKAGTLLEGAQGAGLVPVPQLAPGIVDTLFEPPSVVDLIPSAQATTSVIRYAVEGTATNAAAGVAEGALKPASDLALSTVDEPVEKIATVLTISDELLEDATNVQSYLNSRLSLFVRLEEEAQVLRGAGGNDLVGIFGRTGLNTYPAAATDNNAVAIFRALMGTRGSANLDCTGIIMHPTNWEATRLLRDGTGGTAGQFFGGGPFTGAYGGPARQAGAYQDSLWGVPVVLSSTVGAGTALVGAFNTAARIYRRGGVSVEFTNSHSDYFTKNLVAVRAESRQALCVFREHAFTQITGLD